MIRYLIKNNLKLMVRNKWIIILVILGPLLISMVLGDIFKNILAVYEPSKKMTVGYVFEDDSVFENYKNAILEAGQEAGITFEQSREDDIENTMRTKNYSGFIVFEKDSYSVCTFKDKPGDGMTLQFFMSKVAGQSAKTVMSFMGADINEEVKLTEKKMEFLPQIDSKDYYGITFTNYYTWCGFICYCAIGNIVKNSVRKKYRVTGISSTKYYIANLLSNAICLLVGIGISIVLQHLILDIDFGTEPMELVIFILTVIAACAFGFAWYSIVENMAIVIIATWPIIWIAGFLGGCFETYMLQSLSESIKKISPLYHSNRALVELSTMGKSDYAGVAVLYLTAIIVVCSIIAIGATAIKRRGDQ